MPGTSYRRRAADERLWVPTDAGTSLEFWFTVDAGYRFTDSARTVAATADGDPLGGITDRSGKARHLLQAGSPSRPTLRLAYRNGLPVLECDGADDQISTATFAASVAQPYLAFLAFQPRSTNSMFVHDAADGSRLYMLTLRPAGATNRIQVGAGGAANVDLAAEIAADSWNTLAVLVNGASSRFFHNGTEYSIGNVGSNALGRIRLATSSDGSAASSIRYGEGFVISGASTANLLAGVAYLNRWR